MKISFAALASVAAAANTQKVDILGQLFSPKSTAGLSPEEKLAKQQKETEWYAAGIKGYYVGFYSAFYKTELPEANKKCLDTETISNVVTFQNIVANPMSIIGDAIDIQKDVNMFAQMAEIMENLSVCHFEQPAFDIMSLCTKKPADPEAAGACDIATLTQNMSKDMFVLIGKMTSLAEILQDFPSKDQLDFEEQMRELGSTGGTWTRVIFNFHHPGEQTTHHYHHSSDYDY